MNIRFFLLGADNRNSIRRIETELEYVFSDYLADESGVQSFTELKDASAAIAKAIENTHAVIFMADYEQFSATKLMLSRAFGFQLTCNPELLEKACKTMKKDSEEDYEFSVTHAFVAPNSRIFVLDDGTYAGFAVANGNQTIILLPLAIDRTTVLLTSQVVPYINATYHTSINMGRLKNLNTGKLADKCIESDIKIAVAGTNTASFFRDYAYTDERLKDIINISPITEKRGNMPPMDYIVNLSITASEFMNCRYGIAMSNAFYTGDSPESEKIVYMTVTNERQSQIREVHSFPGEDIPSFLDRCSADLCNFTVDTLNDDEEYIQEIAVKEKALVKRYKISIITVTALIAAVSVFCGVFFHMHDYTVKNWYTNFVEWIFPGGFPFGSSGFGDEAQENISFAPQTTADRQPSHGNEKTTSVFSDLTAKHPEQSNETTKKESQEKPEKPSVPVSQKVPVSEKESEKQETTKENSSNKPEEENLG